MNDDDSGVNLPMAALPAEVEDVAGERYAALREALGDTLPELHELPGDAARVLACSEYVAQSCSRHTGLLHELLSGGDLLRSYADPGAEYQRRAATAVAASEDDAELMAALRLLKRREMVRIAWRDIGGLAGFEETLAETSAFADAVLRTTVDRLHHWLVKATGEPLGTDGSAQRLVVLALGKLGAGELNFSSDIDLIFCFPAAGATAGGRKPLSNDEYFRRLGQRLIKILSERTDNGFVFRVDMRLRPFGSSGPMALNFDAFEDYYQNHGRDWERYALIRARAVTGDPECGDEILERLRPFVYRRYMDFGALESIRDMKTLITNEIERKGLHDNVKLGPGGIREIEFTGQAFQMVRGGRQPELRGRRILNVIRLLGRRGHLPQYAVQDLCAAYRFLRTTEHRLQQVADRQEHTLPGEGEGKDKGTARTLLAAGMGFADWRSFARVLDQHRQHVNAQFSQVFGGEVNTSDSDEALKSLWSGNLDGGEAVSVLQAAGYEQADEAYQQICRIRDTYALKLMDTSGRRRLARLIPDLLRAVASQAHPLVTLQRVFHIVEAVARRSAYLALLMERPLALSQLVRLCAASPWIARQLGRHPMLMDELLDPRSLYAPLDLAALQADIDQRLSVVADQDLEQEMEVLRQFKHANVLHVAAADVSRVMPLMVVSDHLTAIAEVSLRKILALAWRDMTRRFGEPRMDDGIAAPFAIAAYGKLGGLELGYGSDLDIVLLHGSSGSGQHTDGEKSVDNAVFFARLGQRIIHYLTTATAEGTLYQLDFRLRPSGAKGLLVNGIEALRDYLFDDAWTWEHQALVRARVVAGSPLLQQRFADIRREVLLAPRDAETLQREVREMRERMRKELGGGKGQWDLKQDAGGIADIEFMVQYAALRWASHLGDYLDYTDNIRLLEGIADARLMEARDVGLLTDAYRAYRARVHALALQQETAAVGDDSVDRYREQVVAIWHKLMEE